MQIPIGTTQNNLFWQFYVNKKTKYVPFVCRIKLSGDEKKKLKEFTGTV